MGKSRSKIKWLLPLFLPLFAFCRMDFNQLKIGESASYVLSTYGTPYAIYDRGGGKLEYEYVERVSMNNELVYENHYYITILHGQVIDKRFREENRPAYDKLYQMDPNYPTYP